MDFLSELSDGGGDAPLSAPLSAPPSAPLSAADDGAFGTGAGGGDGDGYPHISDEDAYAAFALVDEESSGRASAQDLSDRELIFLARA